MVFSYLLDRELRLESIYPCYFLYGEEKFLAEEFVQQLKETVLSASDKSFEFHWEKFALEEARWADIIDLARTLPFFFAPRQLIVVEGQAENLDELSPVEEAILKDYLRSPSERTILVIILTGKAKKSHPLVKFFLKSPPSSVLSIEIKPLSEKELQRWIEKKLKERAQVATDEAKTRLVELVGSDLRRMANELEKVANFAAEKKVIDIDDINEMCGWIRPAAEYELTNSLEKGDIKQSLVVLNQFFRDGVKEEKIMAILANFFRDLVAAKLLLQENVDRKEIFARIRPFLKPSYSFYQTRFNEFFALVENFSMEELGKIVAELEEVDTSVKTADASVQPQLEAFIFRYCQRRKGKR